MHALTQDYPAMLLGEHEPPCLSLYQPTHRQHPDNLQDPIRFRTLVKALEASLRKNYPTKDIPALLQPFQALADDHAFWNHTASGLAVLGGAKLFRVYRLPRPVAELAVVADSFHTKPLMRMVQSADSYQILGLSRNAFSMYEGNRDALHKLQPAERVPSTTDELLGKEADVREGAHRAYGPAVTSATSRHGTDVKQDAEDRDTERLFRAVDRLVLEHYSQPSSQRLILAALPQHHHLFRAVSRNPHLMEEAIDTYPDALSIDALRDRAWQLVLPHYLDRLAGLVEAFGGARSSGRGADDLGDIGKAAIAGRIETLLIEADRLIPGRLDPASGAIATGDLSDPDVDEVLDDLGEHVLRRGGDVVIVPAERMPTRTGAAALYRF